MKQISLFIILFVYFSFTQAQEFPKEFEWCVATAGHQIEGDNIHSDWWQWEKTPGHIHNNEKSGKASYHMDRLQEDVNLMASIHVKTYRFSIEWSRIEPQQGQFDEKAIAHYKKEIALLKKKNIKPMVTLHHFVQPHWFTSSGGWERPDSPEIFLKYTEKVVAELGNEVDIWTTFNEPTVLLLGGYIFGVSPPGKSSWNFWTPMVNILKAHAKAYHHLHKMAKQAGRTIQVGIAHHIRPIVAAGFLESIGVPYADYLLNWNIPIAVTTGKLKGVIPRHFLGMTIPFPGEKTFEELKNTQDFIGINYYTREYIDLQFFPLNLIRDPLPHIKEKTVLNWGIDPEGFGEVITLAHKEFPTLPFYITENGLADKDDKYRAKYVVSHLKVLNETMNKLSHPIQGYCYWSLMDNFEWLEGFDPRFGLYEVDYKNKGERKARPSLEVIKNIFKTNTLPDL